MALTKSANDSLFEDLSIPKARDRVNAVSNPPQNNVKLSSNTFPAGKEAEPVSVITHVPEADRIAPAKPAKHRQNLYLSQEVAKYIRYESRRRGLSINEFVELVLSEYMNGEKAHITDDQIVMDD